MGPGKYASRDDPLTRACKSGSGKENTASLPGLKQEKTTRIISGSPLFQDVELREPSAQQTRHVVRPLP